MNLQEMSDRVWAYCHDKGWKPTPNRTFGDEIALLHSEVSEALEAYRDYGLEDPTPPGGKPEGVASEFADVLIRLLHYARVHHISLNQGAELDIKNNGQYPSFGDECAKLHIHISRAWENAGLGSEWPNMHCQFNFLLAWLIMFSRRHGFDLEKEFLRKMDYNEKRSYRHGGRTL